MCYIILFFFPSGGGVDYVLVKLWLIKQMIKDVKDDQKFDVPFIQCQTSTYILEIVNEFVQYVQNYF